MRCCACLTIAALLVHCGKYPVDIEEPAPPAGMVLVNAAHKSFVMGSESGDSDERPVRTVAFTYDFFIDTTEVTQGRYASVMGNNPSRFAGDPLRPVEMVTWFDAALYCNALSRADGCDTVYSYSSLSAASDGSCTRLESLSVDLSAAGYRLPTEAEWEYACRGGTTGEFWWGDSMDAACCWYRANSADTTHAAATRLSNAFGLYDMSGNVWEWCNDWYGYYDTAACIDPGGPHSGVERVLRGGSFMSHDISQRPANRNNNLPLYMSKDAGFRVVLPSM